MQTNKEIKNKNNVGIQITTFAILWKRETLFVCEHFVLYCIPIIVCLFQDYVLVIHVNASQLYTFACPHNLICIILDQCH
jgi:hypothetical protein